MDSTLGRALLRNDSGRDVYCFVTKQYNIEAGVYPWNCSAIQYNVVSLVPSLLRKQNG